MSPFELLEPDAPGDAELRLVVAGFTLLVLLIILLVGYMWRTRHDDPRPSTWYRARTSALQVPEREVRDAR